MAQTAPEMFDVLSELGGGHLQQLAELVQGHGMMLQQFNELFAIHSASVRG